MMDLRKYHFARCFKCHPLLIAPIESKQRMELRGKPYRLLSLLLYLGTSLSLGVSVQISLDQIGMDQIINRLLMDG